MPLQVAIRRDPRPIGVIIGAVVASSFIGLAIILVLVFCLRRRRLRRLKEQDNTRAYAISLPPGNGRFAATSFTAAPQLEAAETTIPTQESSFGRSGVYTHSSIATSRDRWTNPYSASSDAEEPPPDYTGNPDWPSVPMGKSRGVSERAANNLDSGS